MSRIPKYSDQFHESFHPFWLGLIMLFTIIVVVGMVCLIRKQCGWRLRCLFNRLRGRSELNDEPPRAKSKEYSSRISSYSRAPNYAPPSDSSPKVYGLFRSIQSSSTDHDTFFPGMEIDGSTPTTDAPVPVNPTRNCETARKFFASLRYTSQYPHSSSTASSNTESTSSPINRRMQRKTNRITRLPSFHTSLFFQSITEV